MMNIIVEILIDFFCFNKNQDNRLDFFFLNITLILHIINQYKYLPYQFFIIINFFPDLIHYINLIIQLFHIHVYYLFNHLLHRVLYCIIAINLDKN